MKTKVISYQLNTFFLLLYTLWWGGCGSDCEIIDQYYYIKPEGFECFPYKGDETIVYNRVRNNDTTTVTLLGNGQRTYYNKYTYYTNAGCDSAREDLYETIRCNYIDNSGGQDWNFELTASTFSPSPGAVHAIILDAPHNVASISYNNLDEDTLSIPGFQNFLKINVLGREYQNVVKITNSPDAITDFTKNIEFYYSKEYGFIKINNRNRNEAYLLKEIIR